MHPNTSESRTGLFQAGALSAILIILVYLIELLVVVFKGVPPNTVAGWFALLQSDRLAGLVQTFALDIIAVGLHAPLYVALYFLLRPGTKAEAA